MDIKISPFRFSMKNRKRGSEMRKGEASPDHRDDVVECPSCGKIGWVLRLDKCRCCGATKEGLHGNGRKDMSKL